MKLSELLTPSRIIEANSSGFSMLADGRILDSRPARDGKPPLVFDPASGSWVVFEGTVGQSMRSVPVTASDADAIISGDRELMKLFQSMVD